ncbi:MAG: GNAT family N-acetyltransferase [Selenomonadaceae bacterium]|nr:GNAT family N-acetyltransferase [Selenomonadaceae bacterium]
MEIAIRKIQRGDAEAVIDMMRKFFSSPATITNGSEKIFAANVENILSGSTCAEGFVFVDGEKIIGYAVTAKSYSTEFGGECIWLEDIFIEAEYRGLGIGSKFIQRVKERYPEKILRLEAEADDKKLLNFYRRHGFKELPYMEMVCSGD